MAKPTPVIDTRTSLLVMEVGTAFTHTLAATGSPTLWEASGLPAGITIGAGTGVVSGTPTTAGVYTPVVKASNFDVRAFTVDSGTDVFTTNGHALSDGDLVTVDTDGTLPAPLTDSDTYEVRDVSGSTYKLAAVAGGAAMNITTTGTGSHTVSKQQSDEITLAVPVIDNASVLSNDEITVEVNVDIVTGAVTLPGGESAVWGPPSAEKRDDGLLRAVLAAKLGDNFPLAIGFTRGGVLQDLAVATLTVGAKEFDPDALYALQAFGNGFTKIGSGTTTRYVVDFQIDRDTWEAVLSNYEEDPGTYLDALAEIEYTLPKNVVSYDDEETAAVVDFTGGDVQNDTHNFTAMSQITAEVAYLLDLSVDFSSGYGGDGDQDAELLAVPFTAKWNGAAFDVTNFTSDFAQGTDNTPDHWRSKLTALTITGTAAGVDVASKLEATGITAGWTIVVQLSDNPDEYTIESDGTITKGVGASDGYAVWNSGDTLNENFIITDGDTAADLKTTLNALPSPFASEVDNVIFDDEEQRIIIQLSGANDIAKVTETAGGDTYTRKLTGGDEHDGTITARVYADEQDNNYRKTSQTFIARIEGDKVEG